MGGVRGSGARPAGGVVDTVVVLLVVGAVLAWAIWRTIKYRPPPAERAALRDAKRIKDLEEENRLLREHLDKENREVREQTDKGPKDYIDPF